MYQCELSSYFHFHSSDDVPGSDSDVCVCVCGDCELPITPDLLALKSDQNIA